MSSANPTRVQEAVQLSQANDPQLRRRQLIGQIFVLLLLFSTLVGLVMLAFLIIDLFIESAGWITPRLWQEYPSRNAEEAGMRSGIVGSLLVIGLTGLFSFPLGLGAAIYLEEYAKKGPFTTFVQVNITNLAGVPSIVYGILGLAVFVRFFELIRPETWFVNLVNRILAFFTLAPLDVGGRGGVEFFLFGIEWLRVILPFERSVLAGALTMTMLILPVVIIASREAIRAVPPSIRQAAYGLGATRWQTVSKTVIPVALPGVMTGMILALSRAIGETAPLIIMGAFTFVAFLPESIWDQFTVMPIQIYNWITLPAEEFRFHLSAAGILVLLGILLSMNAIAVLIRNRFERKF